MLTLHIHIDHMAINDTHAHVHDSVTLYIQCCPQFFFLMLVIEYKLLNIFVFEIQMSFIVFYIRNSIMEYNFKGQHNSLYIFLSTL